jgi:hypothetical protein
MTSDHISATITYDTIVAFDRTVAFVGSPADVKERDVA